MNSPPKRLLLVSHAFPPRAQAGIFRALRFARFLPEFGWQPHVLTVREDDIPLNCPSDDHLKDWIAPQTPVERTSVWRPYRFLSNLIKPLLRQTNSRSTTASECESLTTARYWKRFEIIRDAIVHTPDEEVGWLIPAIWRGWSMIRRHQLQIILVSGPPHSSHFIGCALKRLTGLPLVLDFRDPWARAPWNEGSTPRWKEKLSRLFESYCVHQANRVVLNTDALRAEFQRHYRHLPSGCFSTVTNGYDPYLKEQVDHLSKVASDEPPVDHAWTIIHAGALYGRRDLTQLLAALRNLRLAGHNVRFVHIGVTEEGNVIHRLIRKYQLESVVSLQGSLPHAQTLSCLAHADAILVLQPGTGLQIPSKLFEAMLFDKPLLVLTGEGATRDIARKYGLGEVANDTSSQEIQSAVERLINQSSGRAVGTRMEDALRDFHGRTLTGQMNEILESAMHGRHDRSRQATSATPDLSLEVHSTDRPVYQGSKTAP